MDNVPLIGITLGDPAGIGPEVISKALSNHKKGGSGTYTPVVIGSKLIFDASLRKYAPELTSQSIKTVEAARDIAIQNKTIPVLNIESPDMDSIPLGTSSIAGGHASVRAIEQAATLAQSNSLDAICTAPINKESVALAGYSEFGHQEMLARIAKIKKIGTMLIARQLRVVHLTTHVPFREAHTFITKDRILEYIKMTDTAFKSWGFSKPKIGVAALNPHGGDGGLFGDEESEEIIPAIENAKSDGIIVYGPIPADSIFLRGVNGDFDAIIALYHDQGHIGVKMHDFHRSISVNIGLPYIRTSVDHGTAFDIAGKGIAQSTSMEEALIVASSLASGKGFK